jgi:hypothetical protein
LRARRQHAPRRSRQQIPEVKALINDPLEELQQRSGQIGAELKKDLREGTAWVAFARENGTDTTPIR